VLALGILFAAASTGWCASLDEDKAAIAALDTQYQAAVKENDVATMDRILADDFVLVTGVGKTFNKADLLNSARSKEVSYERQEEIPQTQTVRVWGDTAVVTALLWVKGKREGGEPFDYKLWFSDTYARTPAGWRYVFGQAAQRLAAGS
jgi:ketosteroid isomerase-like protein